jgi:hypothetical protein
MQGLSPKETISMQRIRRDTTEKIDRRKFDFFLVIPLAAGIFIATAFLIFGLIYIFDVLVL